MEIDRLKGKYVIAVSGGVDSVVLLNLLNRKRQDSSELELIVAHLDHGIRSDSSLDCKFVERLAENMGLSFYYYEGHLGSAANEEMARNARYEFLNSIVKKQQANGLITAHHQDDQIETAIINIIRGTGRKGLSSLSTSKSIVRPLLGYSKSEIIDYALSNKLTWREDSTNFEDKYLRNYIRHNVVPNLDESARMHLVSLINRQVKLNTEIDKGLAGILNENAKAKQMPRLWLNSLDGLLSQEVLAAWLRQNNLASFDRATIERLSVNLKTAQSGKRFDVLGGWQVATSRDNLALEHVER